MARDGEWDVSSGHYVFRLKKEGNVLSLGGEDMCVMMMYKGPDDSMLQWLGSKERCELHGFPIKGEGTKHMLYLATTIFRSIFRDVRFLTLLDSSSFKCEMPNGKRYPINLREYNFLFHGKTFYEDKFNAVPLTTDGEKRMEQFRNALYDPSKKPKTFHFLNSELNTELMPIYESSSTWWDFFQQIQKNYGDAKCTKIYLWYRNALNEMVKNITLPEYWKMDIRKFPLLHPRFKFIPKQKGGRRKTRKHRKLPEYYYMDDLWDGSGLFTF